MLQYWVCVSVCLLPDISIDYLKAAWEPEWSNPPNSSLPPFKLECTVSEQGENSLNQKYLMNANRYTHLFNSYLFYLDNFPSLILG